MRQKPWHCLSAALLLLGGVLVNGGKPQFLETVVPVGDTPTDVLWNPTSNKVYTANNQDGTVTIFDGVTNQVRATVNVADYPNSLCLNSINNKVYVTCDDPDWLYVIDGVGDTVVRRVRMRGGPTRMVFNALMGKLYVNCTDDNMIRVYDGAVDTLAAEVWLGELNKPCTMLWHPVSNRVFCTTWGNADSVMVVDCSGDIVARRLRIGNSPYAQCLNRVNDMLYVGVLGGIRALTAAGDSVVAIVAPGAHDMCFVPYPNKVYAVTSGWTYVIDCGSQTVSESLPYGGFAVVSDTLHGKVYGSIYYTNSLYVFDASADTFIKRVAMGRYPNRMCWNCLNSRVYVADEMDNVVYVVRDTSTGIDEPAMAATTLSPSATASPNPFAGTTTIRCGVKLPRGAGIGVFSLDGRQVRMLMSKWTASGYATAVWDGRDESGRLVPRGVYLAVAEGQTDVRVKLIRLD